MKHMLSLLIFLATPLLAHDTIEVLVSVAPQKGIVEKIGKEYVNVSLIVPEGDSPHVYEPSISKITLFQKHHIWFHIGEPFEERLYPLLKCSQVDQRKAVNLIQQGCCHKDAADLHFWMSIENVKCMAQQVTHTLSTIQPTHSTIFASNYKTFEKELDQLDTQLKATHFAPSILVSHPAFAYFCRDYNIEQIGIEQEGKEPSIRQVQQLVAKANGIKKVYLQPQHSPCAATALARHLGVSTVSINPYQENVLALFAELQREFACR